jgi:hypothetical protein
VAAPAAPAEPGPAAAEESPRLEAQAAPESGAPDKKSKKSSAPSTRFALAAPAPAAKAAPMASEPQQTTMADKADQRPEDWLVRIRKLKEQGKLDEAKKELAAFKKRNPNYPVPKDIEIR